MSIALMNPKPWSLRRTILIASMPLAMGAATIGCSQVSQWWQNFQSNPVAQVQSFEQAVQVGLSDAQVAWAIVQPFLPVAQAAQITQQYENAVYAVNGALQVLNDAVQAAIAAQQPSPDFSSLMTAVTNAVSTVISIVAQYVNNAPVPPPLPTVDGGAPPAPAPGLGGAKAQALPSLAAAQQVLDNLKKQIKAPAPAAAPAASAH